MDPMTLRLSTWRCRMMTREWITEVLDRREVSDLNNSEESCNQFLNFFRSSRFFDVKHVSFASSNQYEPPATSTYAGRRDEPAAEVLDTQSRRQRFNVRRWQHAYVGGSSKSTRHCTA